MRRITTALLGTSIVVLLALAAPVLAGGTDCELSVSPTEGPPGTEFLFTGSGYTPTVLTLTQEGQDPRVVELDLGDEDPFEIRLLATEEDAGRWVATASVAETECAGSAVIRVTLPSTATAQDLASTEAGRIGFLLGLAALAVVFVVATRRFLLRFAPRA